MSKRASAPACPGVPRRCRRSRWRRLLFRSALPPNIICCAHWRSRHADPWPPARCGDVATERSGLLRFRIFMTDSYNREQL